MTEKKTVVVGTIGAGYAADLHASGYQRVCGVNVRLKTICDVRLEAAEQIKERYGYEHAASDYEDLLRDPEIDAAVFTLRDGGEGAAGGKTRDL